METLESSQAIRHDQEIDGWRVRIYFWSRDIRLLAYAVALIFVLAAGLGWLLRGSVPLEDLSRQGSKTPLSLHEELTKAQPDPARVFEAIASRSLTYENKEAVGTPETWIDNSQLDPDTRKVALAYFQSTANRDLLPSADLIFFAHWVKPFRFANELVADLNARAGNFMKAQTYYMREVDLHDSSSAAKKLVDMLWEQSNFAALGSLSKDARYRQHFSLLTTIILTAHERRWQDLLEPLGKYEMSMWKPVPVMLALVAGMVWMTIALQAIQPLEWIGFRSIVPFFAMFAGMVCTWPNLFAGIWQEEIWGLRETGEFFPDFLHYVAGVAPREELIKLVFFLPFVPFLLRRGSRLEMLVVAGCVGLGFAIEENLQYFEHAEPIAAFGRFLNANFFHLAATGLIGLSFCDALRNPFGKGLRFVGILLGVTLAHGLYDAFVGVAGLQVLSIFSMIAYLVLALSFLRKLRLLRDGTTDQFSITATLMIGLAVIIAVMFVLASDQLGFRLAGVAIAVNGPSLLVVYYMFYWQLGRGMFALEDQPQRAIFNA